MMAVDFGGEMEQEDDSDAYLDQPPSSSALAAAMGSMTPPQAIIDPAEKLECLKSLHKVSALPQYQAGSEWAYAVLGLLLEDGRRQCRPLVLSSREAAGLTRLCLSCSFVPQEIKNVLEAEIVEILNQGSSKQLLKLHGIGKKRADHILQVGSRGLSPNEREGGSA